MNKHQYKCRTLGCRNLTTPGDFCERCHIVYFNGPPTTPEPERDTRQVTQTMSERYPQYYKNVGSLTEIDVYAVHHLFNIQDPSGAIQHASKKLLLAGVRTGNKSMVKDITEARDTLNRWLELHQTT